MSEHMSKKGYCVLIISVVVGGASLLFGLTVYPFQYDFAESLILVTGFICTIVFETIFRDASF